MLTALFDVLDFHKKMGQTIGDPRSPNVYPDQDLRMELIREESEELNLALHGLDKNNLPLNHEDQIEAVADALGDLLYVIIGAAATWGIDIAGVFDAIHTSNMTKCEEACNEINAQKVAKRHDGKVLKGPNYQPPDIKGALAKAKAECERDGFDDDSWWPEPTVKAPKASTRVMIKNLFPPDEISEAELDKIEEELVEHAKLSAAMRKAKEIGHDASFYKNLGPPTTGKNLTWDLEFGKNQMPAEMVAPLMEKCCDPVKVPGLGDKSGDSPENAVGTKVHQADCKKIAYNGRFLSRGAFMFDCSCERTHEVPTNNGTRGGKRKTGQTECWCGKVYTITFDYTNGEYATFEVQDLGGHD